MARHHRRSYRRKDGTFVRGTNVSGRNPKAGCQMWMLGMIGITAAVRHAHSRASRP